VPLNQRLLRRSLRSASFTSRNDNVFMKICLINNLYQPYNRGGAEKVCETIVAGLKHAGHEVFIITTKPRKQLSITNYQLPPSAKASGDKRIYYLNSLYFNLNKLPKFFRFFWQIWNMFNFVGYFKIKKILQAEKCDVVIANNLMGVGFLTPLAIRSLKIRHLHIVHDIQLIHPSGLMYYGQEGIIDGFFAKIYMSMCRWLFGSPRVVIFPSAWLKELYIKRNFFAQSKIKVLPNPVDAIKAVISTPASESVEKSLKGENKMYKGFLPLVKPGVEMTKNRAFTFLFLGQIEKHKGVFLLIDAFNKIKEKYPEVELLLAGDGSRLEASRKKAAENNNIKFLGWPGEEAADKLLFKSDCLVYPSLVYENCPNAIQRALVAEIPVLASDLGGMPELVNKNAGLLFKPANMNDLAEKMAWLIENKNNLRTPAKIDFGVESYIKELEKMVKL